MEDERSDSGEPAGIGSQAVIRTAARWNEWPTPTISTGRAAGSRNVKEQKGRERKKRKEKEIKGRERGKEGKKTGRKHFLVIYYVTDFYTYSFI